MISIFALPPQLFECIFALPAYYQITTKERLWDFVGICGENRVSPSLVPLESFSLSPPCLTPSELHAGLHALCVRMRACGLKCMRTCGLSLC